MDVEQHHLGAGRRDHGDRLVHIGRLTDDLDTGLFGTADLRLHAGTEHPVVVDEHDPYTTAVPGPAPAAVRRIALGLYALAHGLCPSSW